MSRDDDVDPHVVAALLEQLGGDAAALDRFVADFVGLWPQRSTRLRTALAASDPAEAQIVLLAIFASASMLGAAPLARLARSLARELPARHPDARALVELGDLGDAACTRLTRMRTPTPQRARPQSNSSAVRR